jgi:hypothetical protein
MKVKRPFFLLTLRAAASGRTQTQPCLANYLDHQAPHATPLRIFLFDFGDFSHLFNAQPQAPATLSNRVNETIPDLVKDELPCTPFTRSRRLRLGVKQPHSTAHKKL